jgi:hypothetical protein
VVALEVGDQAGPRNRFEQNGSESIVMRWKVRVDLAQDMPVHPTVATVNRDPDMRMACQAIPQSNAAEDGAGQTSGRTMVIDDRPWLGLSTPAAELFDRKGAGIDRPQRHSPFRDEGRLVGRKKLTEV